MHGIVFSKLHKFVVPGIKGLYMSGYTYDALIQGQGLDESFALLQKPFSQGSVAAKVREVLDFDGFRAP